MLDTAQASHASATRGHHAPPPPPPLLRRCLRLRRRLISARTRDLRLISPDVRGPGRAAEDALCTPLPARVAALVDRGGVDHGQLGPGTPAGGKRPLTCVTTPPRLPASGRHTAQAAPLSPSRRASTRAFSSTGTTSRSSLCSPSGTASSRSRCRPPRTTRATFGLGTPATARSRDTLPVPCTTPLSPPCPRPHPHLTCPRPHPLHVHAPPLLAPPLQLAAAGLPHGLRPLRHALQRDGAAPGLDAPLREDAKEAGAANGLRAERAGPAEPPTSPWQLSPPPPTTTTHHHHRAPPPPPRTSHHLPPPIPCRRSTRRCERTTGCRLRRPRTTGGPPRCAASRRRRPLTPPPTLSVPYP